MTTAVKPAEPTAAHPDAIHGPVFRDLPFMGVIRVNEAAMKIGYRMGDMAWSNLGQGQPEVGEMAGAPPRFDKLTIPLDDHAYGPVEGTVELREAIAAHYNRLYRKGKKSQYTAENVVVSCGGRLALSRCAATLAKSRLGFFTPDYTAYEDLLSTFDRIDPVCIELQSEEGFRISVDALARRVAQDQLDALLISNPCNPTGVAIRGDELAGWVDLGRANKCTLLMDEFYSHFVYCQDHPGPISSAAYLEDVNKDPVIIFDGLTKCFRYPGWRVGWMLAPKSTVQRFCAAGSFLDGGPSRPVQRAAIEVLEPSRADQETNALRTVFADKQRITIDRLRAMGIDIPGNPESTFYVYGSVANLPAPLNDGVGFMQAGFTEKVLTVPGEYFDVDPRKTRKGEPSRLSQFVRFSFGPPKDNVIQGLDGLQRLIEAAG